MIDAELTLSNAKALAKELGVRTRSEVAASTGSETTDESVPEAGCETYIDRQKIETWLDSLPGRIETKLCNLEDYAKEARARMNHKRDQEVGMWESESATAEIDKYQIAIRKRHEMGEQLRAALKL